MAQNVETAPVTARRYSASQIYDMAQHIRTCRVCGDGGRDPAISEGLTEDLSPEDMTDYISSGHDPAWLALMTSEGER